MVNDLKQKIRKHYDSADIQTLNQGLTWYNRAYNEAVLLSQVFEVPLWKVCGVISALSPRNKWARNLSDAWDILETPELSTKTCTFKSQRQKAIDIINAKEENEVLKILGGTKTKHFYTNILRHDTSDCVTVDVWAFRSVGLEPKNKFYKPIETAYRQVAKELGLMPHQVQAVVWGVVRGNLV